MSWTWFVELDGHRRESIQEDAMGHTGNKNEVAVDAKPLNTRDAADGQDAGTGRNETRNEQRDRNWNDLLQELRVMQTGAQIIAGFLLTLPFQQKFSELDSLAVVLYLVLVALAAAATCLMLVPVAIHRQLFGLQVKNRLVTAGHHVVGIVLALVGLLVLGTTTLIFYVVLGPMEAAVVASLLGFALIAALLVYPRLARNKKAE
ncbi:DUF6328 family protein [Arthrobacter sp. H35-D1]|uniref:DUF6328 family protein n=1 Tax=Arthrobacter sp. H35-D1 TaxID=3046202 RepID=UPI0024B92C73|nr:DUF6328 family protein [Arthrobacter sp. H35-D1]MDJ0315430.1 DUF6328 family protein [Arthrobacter sp. H35-D1]